MKTHKVARLISLLMLLPIFSESSAYQPSKDEIQQLRINLCDSTAEKARDIAWATIKSKKADAMPEVMRQTIEGSPEREIMKQLFHNKGLVSSVLLGSAARGARTLPPAESKAAIQNIEELTYSYARNLCISSSLNQ